MQWKVSHKKSKDIIEQLLANRDIKFPKERELFFHPKISDFENDLQIAGIDKAINRILKAIEKNELIVVFGDYDADGICASAILYKALTSLGAKVLPYIPHREKEGYGLSRLGLEFAKDSGATAVITVDNGIVAYDAAKLAKELGLDLIITDHHLSQEKLPEAFAVIHSIKMCGAAVAWCLIKNSVPQSLSQELLQFVAIATVCDMLPLIGLGRAFVFEGLRILNRTENLGLLALINVSGINFGEIGSYEIGHVLGPRLNAIGRLEHAIDALRLLCTKDPVKAKKLAKLLCEVNTTRQQMTMLALDQAKALVVRENKIHILHSKEWSAGIIGLIAGRLSDEYYRPTIAISQGEVVSKGSARSIDGINIVEVIRSCSDILIDVGGHPGAAGFSIKTEHIEIFKKRLDGYIKDLPVQSEKVLAIEAEVEVKQLTRKLVNDLQKLEPFGFGNPRPTFAIRNTQISDIRTVGNGKHLKFKTADIDAIAFGMGEFVNLLQNGQFVDLAFILELDTYNGFERIQLKIKDIKVAV
ncbi:single-stranded-DNA-specific exonuclease RecJ [Candidatus Daviesbacteria bacterium RIFCSPHIGHO2_02_FULL_39_12]|uniref:Single-stranded-DNA-specific exonuclease RecJ n=2 Tax=Candidatus Daviesiibacteriota TaxID=1752718 RepID=A0A1F5JDN4_9BACT|nr:MAG: single-stranded-DNA-specific exonuclease RecJ [Candidatus Daviesbacteria bacterium RIFCSPHIGHO2_02_FULL_39_12]OGE72649.1 MAG: single-stranded-DNA-specific exonuclease RecJ [Candidatus Daviesbacteria bacterium RIFCSPLOWO2_02_FULL_38_15]